MGEVDQFFWGEKKKRGIIRGNFVKRGQICGGKCASFVRNFRELLVPSKSRGQNLTKFLLGDKQWGFYLVETRFMWYFWSHVRLDDGISSSFLWEEVIIILEEFYKLCYIL